MTVYGGPDIITDGLVLHLDAANRKSYPGSGSTIYDLSGNSNDGTFGASTAAPTFSSTNGGCLSFDGGDYIGGSDSSGLLDGNGSPISVFSWINQSTISQKRILSVWTSQFSSTPQYSLFIAYGVSYLKIRVQMTNSSGIFFADSHYSNSIFYNNEWHNIGFTYDNSYLKIYLDGILDNTYAISNSIRSNTSPYFTIGNRGDGGVEVFQGKMGPCAIYKKCLTANEVQQNYNALKGRYGL